MTTHDDPYDQWEAAFVLGALDDNEDREFRAHLDICQPCRKRVRQALLGTLRVTAMPAGLGALALPLDLPATVGAALPPCIDAAGAPGDPDAAVPGAAPIWQHRVLASTWDQVPDAVARPQAGAAGSAELGGGMAPLY